MPEIHRLNDPNEDGVPIAAVPQSTVFANNMPVSVDGSIVTYYWEGDYSDSHSAPETDNGSTNVFIEYIPVNRRGDLDTTNDPRAEGSPDVFVN